MTQNRQRIRWEIRRNYKKWINTLNVFYIPNFRKWRVHVHPPSLETSKSPKIPGLIPYMGKKVEKLGTAGVKQKKDLKQIIIGYFRCFCTGGRCVFCSFQIRPWHSDCALALSYIDLARKYRFTAAALRPRLLHHGRKRKRAVPRTVSHRDKRKLSLLSGVNSHIHQRLRVIGDVGNPSVSFIDGHKSVSSSQLRCTNLPIFNPQSHFPVPPQG